jgi:hypothetical protein
MKQKDILALVVIGIVATVFSSIIASKVFSTSNKHKLKAPDVQTIDSSFPDIKTTLPIKESLTTMRSIRRNLFKLGPTKTFHHLMANNMLAGYQIPQAKSLNLLRASRNSELCYECFNAYKPTAR